MSYRLLIALSAAAAILLLLALWIAAEQAPTREDLAEGHVLPGLSGALAEVERIDIVGAGGVRQVGFVRTVHGWETLERPGWPVDAGRLRDLLIQVAEARRLDPRTARAERHAQLGVEDVEAPDAGGFRIDVIAGERTWRLIVGQLGGQGVGSVVRPADEDQAWLSDQVIQAWREPQRWLVRDLFDLSSRRVAMLAVKPPQGEGIHAVRTDGAAMALAEPPEGKRLAAPAMLEGLAGTLDFLQLEDVARADAFAIDGEGEAPRLLAVFRSAEGLEIALDGVERDGRYWVAFSARVDADALQAWAEAEAERDARALAAAAAPAMQGDPPPDAADMPEAPPLRDAAGHGRLVLDEAERINARVEGWRFLLPGFKLTPLLRPLEDYLDDA